MTISLGEVMIWGIFNGEVQPSLKDGNYHRQIGQGKQFIVPPDH
jgi:hypothetical protein